MKKLGLAILLFGFLAMAEGCSRRNKNSAPETSGDGPATSGPGNPGSTGKKGRGTFTVGKATTYVSGPLESSGHVDYPAALNERLGKGVTPANNAAVLLWKVIGPHPEKTTMPPRFYELLGVQIPEQGEYFVTLRRYVEDHLKSGPGAINTNFDLLTRLSKQPWTANEHPEINSWLRTNEKPMTLLMEATTRTHYFSPLIPPSNDKGSTGLINTLLPGVQVCRELASALLARAMLYVGHGYADAAWQDLLACHRLGRLVGRGATLIEALVGMAIEQLVCQADLVFLERIQSDPKRLEACLRDLRGLPPLAVVAEKVDLCDRYTFLDRIMLIDRHGLAVLTSGNGEARTPDALSDDVLNGIDWNPGLENANRWYDRLVSALREKDRGERQRKLDQVEGDLRALRTQSSDAGRLAGLLRDGKEPAKAKGQVVGDVLISLMMPAVRKVQDAADRTGQTFDNVTVAFALACYHRETGKYPDRLDALAPKYLGQIPGDLFSGHPLIYRPTGNGYLLYSVGPNGLDDGGRGRDEQPASDDLVVRVPLPPTR